MLEHQRERGPRHAGAGAAGVRERGAGRGRAGGRCGAAAAGGGVLAGHAAERVDHAAARQMSAERIGINVTDLNCLNIVALTGPMTAGELARATGLTTASIT